MDSSSLDASANANAGSASAAASTAANASSAQNPASNASDTKGRSAKPVTIPTETPVKRGRPKGSTKAAAAVESGKLRSVADFFQKPLPVSDEAADAASHTPTLSRGRGRGRPRGSLSSSANTSRSVAVTAPSSNLMLDTFFVVGNARKTKEQQSQSMTKEDFTALRQCARKAGSLRLPFITYQFEPRPIIKETIVPSTPSSSRGRGGSTRGRGRGRGAAAAASGPDRQNEQTMEDVQTSTPRSSRGKKEYIHRGGRKIQCAAAVGDESEAAAPAIDLTKPRQTLYTFPSNLTLQSLPDVYQSPPFPDIMSHIKSYMPRFGLNNNKLCQEVNCSNSTIYFLLTNTYKYDLTNFNIRMRHYLWRTDRWCAERTRQWMSKSVSAVAAADFSSMPAEVAANGVTQSDWDEWLECTLTLTARDAITDIVFQHAMACELELTEKFEYQTPVKKEKPSSGKQETLNFTPMDADSPAVSASGRPVRTARVKTQLQYVDLMDDEDDAAGGATTQRTPKKKRKADSDSDASMRSDGGDDDDEDDDSEDEDSVSGAESDGSHQRSKKRKVGPRNTERTRSNMCAYPHTFPADKLLPSDYHQPSAIFQTSSWTFQQFPASTTSTIEDIFSTLNSVPVDADFTSNGKSFVLKPLAAESVPSQSSESTATTDRVDDSINAFIYAGGAVSAMDWCPVGGSAVPPVRASQYLGAAMDTSDGYARVLPGVTTAGIIAFYSSSLFSSQPPQCRMALKHQLGRCIALQWYPHSIDESSSNRSGTAEPARIGVLAAAFSGGAIEVRAIPEPLATATNSLEVTCIDFLSLPGYQLCAPQYLDAPLASPTSLAWSHAPLHCQLAVGMSNGSVHVFDLEWGGSRSSTLSSPSIMDCVASIESGSHVVTGVAFHPTQTYLLALCTSNGESHVYDLRATSRSLLTSVSTHESCRGILWPKVSTPHLQMILVLQRGQINVISLANTQATKMEAIEAMLPATNAFPIPPHAIYQQLAVGARASLSDALFLLAACSDGGCYAAGVNIEIAHKVFGSRSAGPSIVRWQPNNTMDDSNVGGKLDVSDYFGAHHASSRDAMYSLKKQRIAVQKKLGCPEPTQSAANNRAELHCVAVNPNLVFPRVFASAGPAGLIRIQCLRSL